MQSQSAASSSPTFSYWNDASVRNLPVNLFGSVISLSGLALAWRFAHTSLGAPAVIGEVIGKFALGVFMLISLGYLTKLARYPEAVKAEFLHPIAGNFFGTVVISILLVSAVIGPYNATASHAIWSIGTLATFALCFVAVSRLLKGQVEVSHAVPAWFIPSVATLDIPVTGGQMPMPWAAEINLFAGAIGSVLALLLMVLIISRLIHREPLPPVMTPSLMILVAPFAVGFLAYANIVGEVDGFAGLLFYFGLFMFVIVAPKILRSGSGFSSAWWAIGFPLAALVSAALRYAQYRDSAPLWVLAVVMLGTLSLALLVLTIQTMRIALNGKLFT